MSRPMDRRDLLALLGGAGLAAYACRPDAGQRDASVDRARRTTPYQYAALDPAQAAFVAAASECIIPTTETPGAVEAGVPEFVDVIVAEWYAPEEKATFLAGLAELDARSQAEAGAPLAQLDPARQSEFLTQVDAEAVAARKANPDAPTPFWIRLKSLTLYGYYHSAPGSLQELDRPAIPGRFDPCGPLPAARPGAL